MDVQLGESFTALAREVVMEYDHSEADALFDRVLSGTIFSFETNRRIFRGMIRFQDNERWQAVFDRVLQRSRWDLGQPDMEAYLSRAFDVIVDYLVRRRRFASRPARPDGRLQSPAREEGPPARDPRGRAGGGPTCSASSPTTSSRCRRSSLDYWERSSATLTRSTD